MNHAIRAYVFFLPPSPSDTNPPLGPAILASRAQERGLSLDVRDLNIDFLNRYRDSSLRETYTSVGDHGKNRSLVRSAAADLFRQFKIDPREVVYRPDVGDPEPGMHFSFRGIHQAIENHLDDGSALKYWLDEVLDELREDCWPEVIGISLMGPSQVFCSLLLLSLIKRRAPDTLTVLGGSHVTLLFDQMAAGGPYLKNVDVVLPGHSEDEFVNLLLEQGTGKLTIPARRSASNHFTYIPFFDERQLAQYDRDTLTLPVQFTRGCSYAKCTYCTYPIVEPIATKLHFEDAADAIHTLKERHDVTRFSLKDSLLTVPMLTGFSRALSDLGISGVRWSGTTKVVRALIQHAHLFAESGLATLEFGVESIFSRQQDLIDKRVSSSLVEDVVAAMAEEGIVSVVNLMFGFPGETLDEAQRQLAWARDLRVRIGRGSVDFSLNMLEVVRGSPMADDVTYGVTGVAPWAYRYQWAAAPQWRREFVRELDAMEDRASWNEGSCA